MVACGGYYIILRLYWIKDTQQKNARILSIIGMVYFFLHTFILDSIIWSKNFFLKNNYQYNILFYFSLFISNNYKTIKKKSNASLN